jgi:hypothetical protein
MGVVAAITFFWPNKPNPAMPGTSPVTLIRVERPVLAGSEEAN